MFQSLFLLAQPNNAIIGELIRTKVGMLSNILGGLFGGNRNRIPRGYYPHGYYPHRYLSDNDLYESEEPEPWMLNPFAFGPPISENLRPNGMGLNSRPYPVEEPWDLLKFFNLEIK